MTRGRARRGGTRRRVKRRSVVVVRAGREAGRTGPVRQAARVLRVPAAGRPVDLRSGAGRSRARDADNNRPWPCCRPFRGLGRGRHSRRRPRPPERRLAHGCQVRRQPRDDAARPGQTASPARRSIACSASGQRLCGRIRSTAPHRNRPQIAFPPVAGKRRGQSLRAPGLLPHRSVGSSRSRSQSPRMETARVVTTMAVAGASMIQGARVMYSRP